MRYKIITKLKNITHTGARIGRDIEIDSISPPLWAKEEYFKVKIDSFLFYDIL